MTGCSGTDKTDDDYDYIVDWSPVMLNVNRGQTPFIRCFLSLNDEER